MAKFYGSIVKTGRVGASVFRVRAGETIESQYQPQVYNPSTAAQVAARARLKLMSQLAAVMAPVIAMPKRGMMSARNAFVKVNYAFSSYENEKAAIQLNGVQLTSSVIAFPPVGCARGTGGTIAYILDAANVTAVNVSRVVYALFEKQPDNKLRFIGSAVATDAGNDGSWEARGLPLSTNECVLLAYGVRDNTNAAVAEFGNLQAISAETVAQLIVNRRLTENDITLTETRGFTLAAQSA